jgi:alpha-tubulin suppressor-like RCC1 family protein
MHRALPSLRRVLALFTTALVAACGGGGGGGSDTPTTPTAALIGIDVRATHEPRFLLQGDTTRFVALGNYADGTNGVPLSSGVTWTSDAPSVASVDAAGNVTGVSLGNATITANVGSISGKNTLGVTRIATGWRQVSVGYDHVLAVKTDGTLWSWGTSSFSGNEFGQLGTGNTTNTLAPVRVGTDSDWASVAAGEKRSFAIKTDGSLWGWGSNANGYLGDGTEQARSQPTRLGTATGWTAVATKWDHTLALQADGSLWGWGSNFWNQLGLSGGTRMAPTRIGTDTGWSAVSAGLDHSLALKSDGSLWGWGYSEDGQVGTGLSGSTFSRVYAPTRVGSETGWTRVSAGRQHSFAIKADGSLWGWGNNYFGELVNGNTTSTNVPVRSGSANDWAQVASGYHYAVLTKQNGTAWSTDDGTTPTQLGTATTWTQAAVGDHFTTLAVNTAGELGALDSSNPAKVVDYPAGGTGSGPSPSVTVPPQSGGGGGGGGSGQAGLAGTWCADVQGNQNCWVFDNDSGSSNGKFYQQSINQYSGTLTNTMTWSVNPSARTLTYRFTRSVLTNSPYAYDQAVNIGPYTFGYTLTATTFTTQGITFYKR